jgi:hypothetical protein
MFAFPTCLCLVIANDLASFGSSWNQVASGNATSVSVMFDGVVILWMVLARNPTDFTVFVVSFLLLHNHLCAHWYYWYYFV